MKSQRKKKRKSAKALAKSFRTALEAAGFAKYPDYLESKHWKKLKRRLRKGAVCCGCRDAEKNVLLHHVEYGRLGYERPCDLIPMCKECHTRLHEHLNTRWPGESVFFKARKTYQVFGELFAFPYPCDGEAMGRDSKRVTTREANGYARRLEIEKSRGVPWYDKPRPPGPSVYTIPKKKFPKVDQYGPLPESHRAEIIRKRREISAKNDAAIAASRRRLMKENYAPPLTVKRTPPATEKTPAVAP